MAYKIRITDTTIDKRYTYRTRYVKLPNDTHYVFNTYQEAEDYIASGGVPGIKNTKLIIEIVFSEEK